MPVRLSGKLLIINVVGFHDKENYSIATGMTLILKYAIQNELPENYFCL